MSSGLPPTLGVHWLGIPGASTLSVAVPVGHSVDAVDFCVFDPSGDPASERRFPLTDRLGGVAWGLVDGLTVGTSYGLRCSGGAADPLKLLLDPYALAVTGEVDWTTRPGAHLPGSGVDTAGLMPLGVLVDPRFDWGADAAPQVPLSQSVIYEMHVKNATQLHPGVPKDLRGTYAGVAHAAFVQHLTDLGVTAVELLPIHQHTDEERLVGLGLINHWGYNTLGFFAPDHRYSSQGSLGAQLVEFKGMVKLLHEAGIEVILDVVYNHTPEGGRGGPTLSLRGLDPAGWYREPDVTGCGNTMDLRQPAALRLVLDSLRYWVTECHVDGFRFDLATALCRTDNGFSDSSAFLAAINADPVLSTVKLISEPWDVGPGGYQVGSFPAPWMEWNDSFRDTARDVWCRGTGTLGGLAVRMTGSSDLFRHRHRESWTSINYVAAHDGMTNADLCAYQHKHNEANGENGRDGTDNNRSTNSGIEGPTENPSVLQARARMRRNLLATTLLSTGVPMLLAGDEVAHSQHGNNNAYCQDNEISWIDWAVADRDLFRFTAAAIRLRAKHRVQYDGAWLSPDTATWWTPDGIAMDSANWNTGAGVVLRLHGAPEDGEDDMMVLINKGAADLKFSLPVGRWKLALETATGHVGDERDVTGFINMPGSSLAVIVAVPAT